MTYTQLLAACEKNIFHFFCFNQFAKNYSFSFYPIFTCTSTTFARFFQADGECFVENNDEYARKLTTKRTTKAAILFQFLSNIYEALI